MHNPWLDIPVADYEGHMGSPEVGQSAVLGALLGEALKEFRPRDLLLPGCATGNGLAQVDPEVTRRVVAVDINPEYLGELRRRYPAPGFELQAQCADVMACTFAQETFDLVHCALLLEYTEWRSLVPALARAIRDGGALQVVLQLPSVERPAVTPTRFASLRRLDPLFRFVEPAALVKCARECALALESQRTETLRSGKAFAVLRFRRTVRVCA